MPCSRVANSAVASARAFGPQHGMRGDNSINMEESPTYGDAAHGIPVFSLDERETAHARDDGLL